MMKFKFLSILIILITLVSGCSAGKVQTDSTALPKEDNATEITVEVIDVTRYFYADAARKFEEETGIKVNVINNFEGGDIEKDKADTERINAELMSGKGADIYVNIGLDFASVGENGYLCNLSNWIDADTDVSEDEYYMNVLKSEFSRGNIYSFPLFMMFGALYANIEISELAEKSPNWEEFFDLTKDVKRSGVLYYNTDYTIFFRRFIDRYDYFVDEANKNQKLDSPEMVQLLQQCREWSKEGLIIRYDVENKAKLYEEAFFRESNGGSMSELINFSFYNPHMSEQMYRYDLPSDSGRSDKANKVTTCDFICINAASKYKGTAWRFVKFLLREDIQASGFFEPVNRKAATEHLRIELDDLKGYYGLDIDVDAMVKECETILDDVEKIPEYRRRTAIEEIINKEAGRFFNSEITADAAARNMAAGVELYFKEQ